MSMQNSSFPVNLDSLGPSGAPGIHPEGSGGCSCGGGGPSPNSPRPIYAIGEIRPRFPSDDIEKEYRQIVRGADTTDRTDRQILHGLLLAEENEYLARELVWVFSIGGLDAYTVVPPTRVELRALIGSLARSPMSSGADVIVGTRSVFDLPPSHSGGLNLPSIIPKKIYSFDFADFVRQIPNIEGKESSVVEFLDRLPRILNDNVGELDEHRAINYLVMRCGSMYALVAERMERGQSLQGVSTSTAPNARAGKVVDVVFTFADRKTDLIERFRLRVDVTGVFPFLVSKLEPFFEVRHG